MSCDDGMLMTVIRRDKLVEKPEKFIDLLFREIGVVASVFYFKSVNVRAFSSHDVWQGIKAWVANWNAYSGVAFFMQELNQYGFTVEASFAPTAKFDSVDFFAQQFFP